VPRLAVDRDGALALRIEVIEQQRHGHRAKAFGRHADDQAVLVEVVAGNGHGRVSENEMPVIMGSADQAGQRQQSSDNGIRCALLE